VIDDVADANNQIVVDDGRDGYWYTFVDRVGTTISPPAGHKFIQSRGGAHGLPYAARMLGKVSASGSPQYAAMGFDFTNPRAAYDASKYTGVSFYARVGARSQTRVRLNLPDVETDPQGNVCTVCSNDFGVDLELTDNWEKFTIGFAQMRQQEGWGSPQTDQIDPANVYGMHWQVSEPGASYDVWVSDVQFSPYEVRGRSL
jgi:endoglucanase